VFTPGIAMPDTGAVRSDIGAWLTSARIRSV
jgi:hypothetical protein